MASTGADHRPGSFSVSAIGYAGFYDLLKQMDRPVTRGLGQARSLVGANGTLVVAEPDLWRLDQEYRQNLIHFPRLLLVLPKWRGYPSEIKPAWIERAALVDLREVQKTLALVEAGGQLARQPWPTDWSVNKIGPRPEGAGQIQLIKSPVMTPVVALGEAILVGEIKAEGKIVWVVSDPDVLANHGLQKGRNAAFAVALIDRLRLMENDNPRALVVFDEAVHGFIQARDSFLKMVFRFPWAAVIILITLAAALLFWAGTGRFGAPRAPRPPLDFGKGRLIDNSARFLDFAGHHASVLQRYVKVVIRSAAEALHAPTGLDAGGQAAWLDQIGRARGVKRSSQNILQNSIMADSENKGDLARLFECAWDIHHWKGEILNGSAKSRSHN